METLVKWVLRLRFLLYLDALILSAGLALPLSTTTVYAFGIALTLIASVEFLVRKARTSRIGSGILAVMLIVIVPYATWLTLFIMGPSFDVFS